MPDNETLTISPVVAMEEALLKAQNDEAYYRNRIHFLAQTVANQKAELAATSAPEKKEK